ncbi:MAG: hypothetical protein DRJ09_01905 [Bacteroidetes bacterium]|nr:MAG: hypothetical protein DRJ09_01905 [Bacteroidota bacterium]
MNNKNQILGVFDDPDVVTDAVKVLVKHDVKIKDVFSPFPLEHVWELLKLKTRIPYATFIYGVLGTSSVFAFLYWTSVTDYPLTFGGKPHLSLSFVIIMFVLTILFGVVLTLATLLIREKMWPGKNNPLPDHRSMDDKFVIVIEQGRDMDEKEIQKINELLKQNGAVEVNRSNV